MQDFGVYRSVLQRALRDANGDPRELASLVLRTSSGEVDGLVATLARRSGPERFATALSAASGLDTEPLLEVARALLSGPVVLTGAEAAALVLAQAEIELAFAYAGTSELALCDATARTPGIELVNGRGDKESAFMAAGANLLRPRRGVAIIHGAPGLTNAGGAIADALMKAGDRWSHLSARTDNIRPSKSCKTRKSGTSCSVPLDADTRLRVKCSTS